MGDSELACQLHAHRQGNGMVELLDRKLAALEDIIQDGSCEEAVHALYSKVARASGSSKFPFRAAGVRRQNFEFGMETSTMNLKFARHWRNCKALLANSARSVVNGTSREDGASDVLGTRVPFRNMLLQRLDHLGAERTTPAQRPRLRIVLQQLCQVPKDIVVKMLWPVTCPVLSQREFFPS